MSGEACMVPIRSCPRAVFLDVDGTMIEIARTPDAVRVPQRLQQLLARTAEHEGGALALISGRRLSTLDALFAPLRLPAAGLHGLERRDAQGVYVPVAPSGIETRADFVQARSEMMTLARRHPALVFEDKGPALALHFRAAPEQEAEVFMLMQNLVARLGPAFNLQAGKCVLEIRPAGASKRTAIEAFMREVPFCGRYPVFVGDDITDEEGFIAVNALGGDSIRVGEFAATAARWQLRDVPHVLDWLEAGLAVRTTREERPV